MPILWNIYKPVLQNFENKFNLLVLHFNSYFTTLAILSLFCFLFVLYLYLLSFQKEINEAWGPHSLPEVPCLRRWGCVLSIKPNQTDPYECNAKRRLICFQMLHRRMASVLLGIGVIPSNCCLINPLAVDLCEKKNGLVLRYQSIYLSRWKFVCSTTRVREKEAWSYCGSKKWKLIRVRVQTERQQL